MFAFLFVLFRVIVIVCVIGALLTIRKTRLRHIPARQTRVSRHDGESTRWLNSLADSIQDCAACVVRGTANQYAATVNNNNNNNNSNDVSTVTTENAAHVKKQVQLASEIEQSNWLFSCLLLWKRPFHGCRARANYMEFYNLRDLSNEQSELQEMKAWMLKICVALYKMFMCVLVALVNYILHIAHLNSEEHTCENNVNVEESVNEEVKIKSTLSTTAKFAENSTDQKEQCEKIKKKFGEENDIKDDNEAEREWFRSNKIVALIEERVNGTLEDRGIAAWSDFRIHSLGNTPPRIQILSIKPKTTLETHISPSAKPPSQPTEQIKVADVNILDINDDNNNVINPTNLQVQEKTKLTSTITAEESIKTNTTNATSCIDINRNSSNNNDINKIDTNDNKFIVPFELECEAELEYRGDLDISLRAEVCFWRGRRLPLEVRMGAVRLIRCHIFSELEIQMRASEFTDADSNINKNKGNTMILNGKMWLESNPLFDLQIHTKFSRLGITNCFLIPLLVKYGFLYFVHKYLRRSEKAKGISFSIPLQN